MVDTTNQAYITQFSGAIHDLLEQGASKLRATVGLEMAKGEKHMFERLGSFTATEVTQANAPTDPQDAAHSRRMATVRRYKAATTLDDINRLKMLIDPANDYTRKLAAAHGRTLDDVILAAMLGTASTGADGTGTQAFDTTNQQIAHGSTGLTVAKLNQALRILEANEVDLDNTRLYLAVGAHGKEDLLAEALITSIDYQDGKVLATGRFPQVRGVNIVSTQRIPAHTAGSVARAILYTEDALKVAMAQDLTVKVGENFERSATPTIITFSMFGAVRMDEQQAVDILYSI